MNVGAALRVLRHSRQVSGHEMARRLGVTRARMYQLEREDGNPTLESVTNYLEAIDAPLIELAMVTDELFDVILRNNERPSESFAGSLRFTDRIELRDDQGDHARDYKSIPDMIDACEEAGFDVYLRLET